MAIGDMLLTNTQYYQDIADAIRRKKDAPKELQLISSPTKTEYYIGQTLDLTGLQINLIYKSGKSVNVTNSCTFTPSINTPFTNIGDYVVTATYSQSGFTEEIVVANITVTVDPEAETRSLQRLPFTLGAFKLLR